MSSTGSQVLNEVVLEVLFSEVETEAIVCPNGRAVEAIITQVPRPQPNHKATSSAQRPPTDPHLPFLPEAPPHRCAQGREPCTRAACRWGRAAPREPFARTVGRARQNSSSYSRAIIVHWKGLGKPFLDLTSSLSKSSPYSPWGCTRSRYLLLFCPCTLRDWPRWPGTLANA